MEKLLYTGKAKQMWQTEDPAVLRVVYLDQATALNGKKKDHFTGKGEAANAISSLVFDYLMRQGIETHFIKKLSTNEDLVKKCEMFPLEFVTRNVIAGHFASRYGLSEGEELPSPVEETFYKSDELNDPFINESATIALKIASKEELAQMWGICLKFNNLLKPLFAQANLRLVDFKLEFGRYDGEIILCDEISPDSCRLWDAETGKKLDKDRFRRDLGDVLDGYRDVLR
ncbi:MAG: phosphoribosylaminoimidazolesuccinocarboxamide synthase, partial [Lactobacillus sp.]|nr:phosphoribosylaminoimidazolesuccinocarboxamide synthase [Lactobacillus sp.]